MKRFAIVIAVILVWAGATGLVSLPVLAGGVALVLLALAGLRGRRSLRRLGRILALGLLFIRELVVSGLRVTLLVLSPRLKDKLRPAIVAVPLTVRSDAEITLLANLITLTPGTLSIDVSEDRQWLHVHVLTLEDREALIADIAQGFEKKVSEVFA